MIATNGIKLRKNLGTEMVKPREQRKSFATTEFLYTHLHIEHNHCHHLHVATPSDQSTTQIHQKLYSFWRIQLKVNIQKHGKYKTN